MLKTKNYLYDIEMMTIEKAREIWKYYDMTDGDLEAWVRVHNNRPPDPPGVHKGETIEIKTCTTSCHFVADADDAD